MVANRQDAYRRSPTLLLPLRSLVHIRNLLTLAAAQLASRLRRKSAASSVESLFAVGSASM
jgi:hypothetical protein